MQFIIMHKTNAHWEAGAIPTPELIGRVGGLLGQIAKAGSTARRRGSSPELGGSAAHISSGTKSVTNGPFERGNELPAAFSIVRTGSLDEAVEWASRQATVLGDVEVDIRPVTEPWDIGIGSRPPEITTRRYMVLRKATAATEAGIAPSSAQRAELARLVEETAPENVHVATVTMRPSARGRRYKNSTNGVSVVDGPFTESKS